MKLSEVFNKCEMICTDKKARRVSNVSRKVANITAEEIEAGVTIERLENLNVPVFQYATQITVHGKIPGFSDRARPAGYKSIFCNQNGTLGVRYVAIDAPKKARLVEMARYCSDKKFHCSIDSTGLHLVAFFEHKEDCVKSYNDFPRDCFAGSLCAGAGLYGGYYLIAEVGAIPQERFPDLVKYLFGINEDEFDQIKAKKDAEDKIESENLRRQHENALQEQANERNAALALVAAQIDLKPLSAIPEQIGSRFVSLSYNSLAKTAQAVLYVITKKVFGKPYYAAVVYNGANSAWQPDKKTTKQFPLERRRPVLLERLNQGYVWKV